MSYQDFEEQEPQQDEGEQSTQRPSGLWILLLIIGLIVAVIFYSGARIGGGGLKGAPGGGFDAASRAYALAQETEAYRKAHRSNANYCNFEVILEDSQGKLTTLPGLIYDGYGRENTNHCEQKSLRYVQYNLFPNKVYPNLKKIQTVHILIFSQVRVCDTCDEGFPAWQQKLQQLITQQPGGANVTVDLSVWEIQAGSPSGFAPANYPYGPYTPGDPKPHTRKPTSVRAGDVIQVYP